MDVKFMLVYNIKPHREAEYYRYIMGEFLPTLQNAGMYMTEGWHTAYGTYPIRLIVFQSDSRDQLEQILAGSEWKSAKEKLMKFVRDYEERIVPAKNVFQFFLPSPKQ
jgi:predicted RNA-binding protein with PIN domain